MYDYFFNLSKKYNMPLESLLSVAINRYGILSNEIEDSRIRFSLGFEDSDVTTFFAVCVNTYLDSPFKLVGEELKIGDKVIGHIKHIEKDTCTSTYFRDHKKAITFNSNSRSKCVGCTFCGTYSLDEEDNYDFSSKENVKEYFGKLLSENGIKDLSEMKNITVCTGCFEDEKHLVDHLYLLNDSFKEMNFNGNLNYIGSQLRTYSVIDDLLKEVDNFSLFLTLEKFLDREKFMRREKASLTLEKAKELLQYVKEKGATATYLYILGLEDIETVKKYYSYFKDSVNKFPITQVFQDYTAKQEGYRCEEAKDFEYYLKARQAIMDIYKDTALIPEDWENFRSLNIDKGSMEPCKCLIKK